MFVTDVVIPMLEDQIRRLQGEITDAISRGDKVAALHGVDAQLVALNKLIDTINSNSDKQS